MAHVTDTARAIVGALIEAHSAGRPPQAIVLDEVTRQSLQDLGLGYWSAGRATWSLFNVPVEIGPVSGWRLWLSSEPAASPLTWRPVAQARDDRDLSLGTHLHDLRASQ